MRMLGGALVAFCSMLIVMQDWDFPDFSGGDIKITAVDFEAIQLPACTYTINEDDNYVWFKDYAWVMNLMCAIPIFGIVMLVWLIANHEHVTCFNRKKVRDWAASAQRRGSNVDLAARAEAQADTTDSRCGGCLCCCGPRPDVLVEHEAQREARIAAHRGVLPGLEPDAGDV